MNRTVRFVHPGRGCGTRFVCPGRGCGTRFVCPGRGCGTRFVCPGRACGTRGALRMVFSQTLWLPACPERSRRIAEFTAAYVRSHFGLPASSFEPPTSRTVAHVCSHNELPTSSLQLPTSRTELPTSDLQPQTSRTSKPFALHSYEKRACKSFGILSYAIVGLKVPWNEYLQKKGGWGAGSSPFAQIRTAPAQFGQCAEAVSL